MPGQAVNGSPSDRTVPGAFLHQPPGWFGKVSMLGDFASRRLEPPFVRACDDWLSRGIAASRAELGPSWLETYLSAPIWRFAWAPGLLDHQWWFGVLMPSVDAVGRYFPLVVATARPEAPGTAEHIVSLSAWYAQIVAAAMGTLAADATIDAFETSLSAAYWPEPTEVIDQAVPAIAPANEHRRFELAGSPSLMQWAALIAWRETARSCAGHGLWWPVDSSDRGSFSVARGLPAPEQFALLLRGQW